MDGAFLVKGLFASTRLILDPDKLKIKRRSKQGEEKSRTRENIMVIQKDLRS
jgi:hypothetical protein